MKIVGKFLPAAALLLSCTNSSKVLPNEKCISEKTAKEIVAKEISESDYYQQYYVTTSDKFDDRVLDITWGDTVLVSAIPDGRFFTKEEKYYILTGVLPDGQVLAAQTVNAHTGELMDGALLINENSDVLRIATESQASEYAAGMGYPAEYIEAVFYYDGTVYTSDPIFSWKYCINTKNNRSIYDDSTKLAACLFIDPWVNMGENKENRELSKCNTFFSKADINHRLFVITDTEDGTYRSLCKTKKRNIFIPVD